MRWIALVGLVAVAAFLAACGGGGDSGSDTAGDTAAHSDTAGDTAAAEGETTDKEETAEGGEEAGSAMKAEGPATVKVIDSEYGKVIADAHGEAYYLFDKEESPESECFDECAEAWPPAVTDGEPQAGSGADQELIGTTERPNGEIQITYDGHPLYYYKGDSPGTILCQNVDEFGGLWLVVQPDGEPVT